MIERKVTVKIEHGLHARPCCSIVEKRLKCDLEEASMTKISTGMTVDMNSIINMLLLVGNEGDEYVLRAKVKDEEQFIEYVEELLSKRDPFIKKLS